MSMCPRHPKRADLFEYLHTAIGDERAQRYIDWERIRSRIRDALDEAEKPSSGTVRVITRDMRVEFDCDGNTTELEHYRCSPLKHELVSASVELEDELHPWLQQTLDRVERRLRDADYDQPPTLRAIDPLEHESEVRP